MTNKTESKIEQLKSLHQAKTSEQLFQIEEPIDFQCPKFDELSKKAKDIHSTTKIGRFDADDYDGILDKLKDIEWESSDLVDQIEELRDAIVSVRQWGEDWKKFAKMLVEQNDIEMDKYV